MRVTVEALTCIRLARSTRASFREGARSRCINKKNSLTDKPCTAPNSQERLARNSSAACSKRMVLRTGIVNIVAYCLR